MHKTPSNNARCCLEHQRQSGSGRSEARICARVASAQSEWLVLVLPLEECLSPFIQSRPAQ